MKGRIEELFGLGPDHAGHILKSLTAIFAPGGPLAPFRSCFNP